MLFHQGLTEYLSYSNSDSKNYLEWEKEIRIKSILLMHILLENCYSEESLQHQQQQMFLRQSTLSLPQSSNSIAYQESSKLISNASIPSSGFPTLRES